MGIPEDIPADGNTDGVKVSWGYGAWQCASVYLPENRPRKVIKDDEKAHDNERKAMQKALLFFRLMIYYV